MQAGNPSWQHKSADLHFCELENSKLKTNLLTEKPNHDAERWLSKQRTENQNSRPKWKTSPKTSKGTRILRKLKIQKRIAESGEAIGNVFLFWCALDVQKLKTAFPFRNLVFFVQLRVVAFILFDLLDSPKLRISGFEPVSSHLWRNFLTRPPPSFAEDLSI